MDEISKKEFKDDVYVFELPVIKKSFRTKKNEAERLIIVERKDLKPFNKGVVAGMYMAGITSFAEISRRTGAPESTVRGWLLSKDRFEKQ